MVDQNIKKPLIGKVWIKFGISHLQQGEEYTWFLFNEIHKNILNFVWNILKYG